MANDAWMPLYIGDYLADTADLTTEEHGAYLLLMMHYWKTGPLPADPNRLKNICKMSKYKFFQFFDGPFQKLFSKRNEKYFHKRLDKEMAKATEISQKRAEAGRRGGVANAKAKSKLKPTQSQSHIRASVSSLRSETDGEPKSGAEIDPVKVLFDSGLEVLTAVGMEEKKARALIGRLRKSNDDPEAQRCIDNARTMADPQSYLAACAVKVHLPNDNQALWKMRKALGLDPMFEDMAECHDEIRDHLRANPKAKTLVADELKQAKQRAAGR